MEKIAELKNSIDNFIHTMIYHPAWKIAQVPDDLHSFALFYLHKSFSLDPSDETTFQITLICLTICWRKFDCILYPYLTTISSYILQYFLISDETSSSATVPNYFHIMYQSNCCIGYLFFSFPSFPCLFIDSIVLPFSLFGSWIFCYSPSWVPTCFRNYVVCTFSCESWLL